MPPSADRSESNSAGDARQGVRQLHRRRERGGQQLGLLQVGRQHRLGDVRPGRLHTGVIGQGQRGGGGGQRERGARAQRPRRGLRGSHGEGEAQPAVERREREYDGCDDRRELPCRQPAGRDLEEARQLRSVPVQVERAPEQRRHRHVDVASHEQQQVSAREHGQQARRQAAPAPHHQQHQHPGPDELRSDPRVGLDRRRRPPVLEAQCGVQQHERQQAGRQPAPPGTLPHRVCRPARGRRPVARYPMPNWVGSTCSPGTSAATMSQGVRSSPPMPL